MTSLDCEAAATLQLHDRALEHPVLTEASMRYQVTLHLCTQAKTLA